MQRLGRMIEDRAFGQIIEVNTGFLHASDLDPDKPINWKRMVEINGEYGCMGDLGMHPCHVPFRAGWWPRTVRAVLSNIVQRAARRTAATASPATPGTTPRSCATRSIRTRASRFP